MIDNYFKLDITLGNDDMRTPEDVAQALEKIAKRLRDGVTDAYVMGENGTSCGGWSFVYIEDDWTAYEDDDQRLGGNDNPYED